MSQKIISVAILLFAIPCSAKSYKVRKKVDPGTLQRELKAKGFLVNYVSCYGDAGCQIVLDNAEKKDPKSIVDAHVYVDPVQARRALVDELATLEAKLDAGTADIAELRRAMKIVLKLSGLSRNP